MRLKDFKQQAKNLAVAMGLRKSDVSITSNNWLHIRIRCDYSLFDKLSAQLEQLAGFKNHSDVCTDYFKYDVDVQNSYGTSFAGLLITKSSI